jgi:hypothetical protein
MPLKNRKSHYFAPISALFVGTALLLTGCTNGADAPTRMIKQVTDGVEATSGQLKVRDFFIVAQEDGSGVIVGTIINSADKADAITSITANNTAVTLTPAALTLNTDTPVIFSGDTANAQGVIKTLGAAAGDRVPVEITFASQAVIKLDALIVPKTGDYAGVSAK